MTKITAQFKKEAQEKFNQLNVVRKQLKQEFVGINKAIDEIIDAIHTWYIIPAMLQKPLVVNLWGLTGCGKSSLLKRLFQLLHYEDNFHSMDLSELSEYELRNYLEEIGSNSINDQPVFVFDEFQSIKTINKLGIERENPKSKLVWQLLDNGSFVHYSRSFRLSKMFKMADCLLHLNKLGVTIEKGIVIKNSRRYEVEVNGYLNETVEKKKGKYSVFELIGLEDLFKYNNNKFNSYAAYLTYVQNCNLTELADLIFDLLGKELSPEYSNFKKALIFVVGNLDDAYKMAKSMDADIDADIFYKESLNIKLPHIKRALRLLFRAEQIARLGNNHIIYPAFSAKAFEQIIELQFKKISNDFNQRFGIKLIFNDSAIKFIYDEGVFPAQGARPVLSTIEQQIQANLSKLIIELLKTEEQLITLEVSVNQDQLLFTNTNNGTSKTVASFPLQTKMIALKNNSNANEQALIAVHEAGHAIAAICLLNTIPNEIVSSTSDTFKASGYNSINFSAILYNKEKKVKHIAMLLAGRLAEQLIFGASEVGFGSFSDLDEATTAACEMVKIFGFNEHMVTYNNRDVTSNFSVHEQDYEVNEQVITIVKRAEGLALNCLKKNYNLLLEMSAILSKQPKLKKADVEELLISFGISVDSVASNFNYKETLNLKLEEAKILK